MRESKIQYNPSLSVAQNAKRNGVSEAAIRYYIKVNNIDRRFDRTQNLIADCRKYLKKHPNATKAELHEKTGHSLSTIRIYWEHITTEKELTNFDNKKKQKRQLRQLNNFYATHPSCTADILMEEEYIKTIITYVCENGDISLPTLVNDTPFCDCNWVDVFGQNMISVKKYVEGFHKLIA